MPLTKYVPSATADGLAEHAGVLVPHGHRHARQHRPLRVEHPAADFGGSLLRERRGDAEQQGEHPRTGLPDHPFLPLHPCISPSVRYGRRKADDDDALALAGTAIQRSGSLP